MIILIVGECSCDNQDVTREMQKSIVNITFVYKGYLSATKVCFLLGKGKEVNSWTSRHLLGLVFYDCD